MIVKRIIISSVIIIIILIIITIIILIIHKNFLNIVMEQLRIRNEILSITSAINYLRLVAE
jgi:hypothetical protein